VLIPEQPLCCGRPLYDYGMLATAKRYLERILRVLAPHLEAGTPIVVLEPSCASVFRDELPNLLPRREAGKRLTAQTLLLSEFLMKYAADRLPRLERTAIVQGHCHHKSVLGFDAQKQVFERMGLQTSQPASGCCGLAGSFGFEAEKYAVSSACAERVIWPAVRRADPSAMVLADGFSCRTQIEHGTGRRPLHLAEALQLALEPPSASTFAQPPERIIAARRERSVRRSMRRARVAVIAGALGAFGVGALLLARKLAHSV
jgi:Fe-S oxidoreductase